MSQGTNVVTKFLVQDQPASTDQYGKLECKGWVSNMEDC